MNEFVWNVNIDIIVSIVQQNLLCQIYMITSLWMNLLCNVNININKYIIVSIDHVNLAKKILLNNTYNKQLIFGQ